MRYILRDFKPMAERGKFEGFFNDVENMHRLGGLFEDIRDAVIEYQVSIHELFVACKSDVCTRLHYNKISTIKTVDSL